MHIDAVNILRIAIPANVSTSVYGKYGLAISLEGIGYNRPFLYYALVFNLGLNLFQISPGPRNFLMKYGMCPLVHRRSRVKRIKYNCSPDRS